MDRVGWGSNHGILRHTASIRIYMISQTDRRPRCFRGPGRGRTRKE